MSMLSAQSDELRILAGELRQILEYNADWTPAEAVTLSSSVDSMREAADTIDAMLDRLYELQHVSCDSRWHELFGTPERAARTLEELELDQLNWCRGTDYCEKCPYEFDRYGCYPPDGFSLLEWLRGDVERLTCRNKHGHCSVCSAIMYDAPNYCPNCGAKVVGK